MGEAKKLISVGCRLPQGLIIEVGYEIKDGGIIQTDKYQRIELKGANQHSKIEGLMRTPSPGQLQPGITHNVDAAAFAEWVEKHKSTNIVKNMLVFEADSPKEIAAMAKELGTEKTGMEPVDPSKHPGIKTFKEETEAA